MIIGKGDLRKKTQRKNLSQFTTDETFCAVEAGLTVLLGNVVTDYREEYLCHAQVNGHFYSYNGDKPYPRVIKPLGKNGGNRFMYGLGYFIASFMLHTLPGSRTGGVVQGIGRLPMKLKFGSNLLNLECFDDIADLDIVEVFNAYTTFITAGNLSYIVFYAAQR